MERNRQEDLEKLALAFFVNLRISNVEQGAWGLDDKRPFGSSYLEGDVLEIIGCEPESENGYSPEQDDYASQLYSDLGDYLASEWRRRKTSAA